MTGCNCGVLFAPFVYSIVLRKTFTFGKFPMFLMLAYAAAELGSYNHYDCI